MVCLKLDETVVSAVLAKLVAYVCFSGFISNYGVSLSHDDERWHSFLSAKPSRDWPPGRTRSLMNVPEDVLSDGGKECDLSDDGMNDDLIVLSVDKNCNTSLKYHVIHNPSKRCVHFDDHSIHQWIDRLGEESAQAQSLKQSITSYKKLIDDKTNDRIYLLVNCEPNGNSGNAFVAVGFVRFGTRNLWFADKDNTNLRRVDNCICILDFYVRHQRRGLGRFLIGRVIDSLSVAANQMAYDRPTQAMLTFLAKHFGLSEALRQHNHFVIFESFRFD